MLGIIQTFTAQWNKFAWRNGKAYALHVRVPRFDPHLGQIIYSIFSSTCYSFSRGLIAIFVCLRTYSGNDREQDLRAYEGKQLLMYQKTSFFGFFCIHLRRRLRGEVIVCQSSRRPSVRLCVHTFKYEYL